MLNNQEIILDKNIDLSNKKVGIVQAKFNLDITNSLLDGTINVLRQYKIEITEKDIYLVPGAFEIPYMVQKIINDKKYDAVICLGCLIRGESDHYDSTRVAVTNQLCSLSCSLQTPIVNGILNVHDKQQALARSGLIPNSVNLGIEYAYGLCRMWIDNQDK